MHILLDLRGNIPTLAQITPAAVHEVTQMDQLCTETGAIYIVDRGYLAFARRWRIRQRQAFFLTCTKSNTQDPARGLANGGSGRGAGLRPGCAANRCNLYVRTTPNHCAASPTSISRPVIATSF